MVVGRRVLRTSVARSALLVFVLATSLGFALFSATAARRTTTAFDRFVAWSDAADVVTGGAAGDVPVADLFDDIEALPSVVDSQRSMAIGLNGAVVHGNELPPPRFFASATDLSDTGRFDRPLVLEGSIPDEPSADQGVVDFGTARQLDLEVGDEVTLIASPSEDVPPVEVPIEVVAVVSVPSTIPTVAGYQFNGIVMGQAFLDAHPELVDPYESSLSMRLRHGLDSVDDLRDEMRDAGLEVDIQDRGSVEVGAKRLFTLEATTMWVAACLALLVGLPVAYQLLRRDAAAGRRTVETVLALGASRRQIASAAAARAGVLAIAASALAAVGSVVASPLSPVGLARNAEVDRGIYVDGFVLAAGIALFIAATVLLGWLAAVRGALSVRAPASGRAPRTRQPRVPVAVGMRMATGSRGAVAVAGIGALAFVSLLVVGIAVAASSLESVPDDPEVSGGSWDGFMVVGDSARAAVDKTLDQEPEVSSYGPGGWTSLVVDGQEVYTLYLPDDMEPAIAAGRAPTTDHEIALGAEAMRRLGVGIGDEVPASFPGSDLDQRRLTVTGESISAAPLFFSHAPDDSAVVAFDLTPSETDGSSPELVRFTDRGRDPQATLEQIKQDMPDGSVWFSFARSRRGDIVALEELEGLIRAILVMAAVLALASLLHQVLVTNRRNVSELAVLRAVGFTSGNVTEAGVAHGGTLASLTALVAIPVGLAAGSVAWRYLADELVVLPRTRYDLVEILAVGAAVVLLAALIAGALARRGARRPVARALRAE
jgi:ABC-type lipoprotein release transport system permease subunit